MFGACEYFASGLGQDSRSATKTAAASLTASRRPARCRHDASRPNVTQRSMRRGATRQGEARMRENHAMPMPGPARRQAGAAAAGPAPGRKHQVVRRGLLPLAVAAVVLATGAGSASAATPVHIKQSVGQVRVAGQSWHLRAEDGRLVLSGAGLIATDLLTGDTLRQTPGALASVAATVCPALGGSPAG